MSQSSKGKKRRKKAPVTKSNKETFRTEDMEKHHSQGAIKEQ
ncbi:hypothetical protein SH2C18_34470 [Clostridium sediminicola]